MKDPLFLHIAEKLITHPDIKVISFDIFDTLIQRPCIYPEDIFILLNNKVKDILNNNINFSAIRKDIERKIKEEKYIDDREINYDDIYNFISKKYKIDYKKINEIKNEELKLELTINNSRKIIKERLYSLAIKTGKKIICISDMYHNADFLNKLLLQNKYKVDKIYVSSEINKRKDKGDLFDYVLSEEKIKPYELLHIGDNKISDFEIPIKKGIVAFHIPKTQDVFYEQKGKEYKIWNNIDLYSPYQRIIMGFYINKWEEKLLSSKNYFDSIESLAYFGVGPVLLSIALWLRDNANIQKNYDIIHFASRDGYLPLQAYKKITKKTKKNTISGKYLYCGRSLSNIANYEGNALDYVLRRLAKYSYDYNFTIGDLFASLFHGEFIKNINIDNFRNFLLIEDKKQDYKLVKEIIQKHYDILQKILVEKKNNVRKYYQNEIKFSADNRAVIFDCGYSGSISVNIMKLIKGKIDKIYLWESKENEQIDDVNQTKTYVIFGELENYIKNNYIHLLFEELFSSVESQCQNIEVDKNGNYIPVFDKIERLSKSTKSILNKVHNNALHFIDDFIMCFCDYLDEIQLKDISFSLEPIMYCLYHYSDNSIQLLNEIIIQDNFYGNNRPLDEKLELPVRNHLLRTPFVNSDLVTTGAQGFLKKMKLRICIHIHLYHVDLYMRFIKHLYEYDINFDVVITTCSTDNYDIAKILFSKHVIPKLNKVYVKIVPNRGRDIAPWLIECKNLQDKYDLFCHVHTKKSSHFAFGDEWREYLLENLISISSLNDIISVFSNNKVGIIFPPMFRDLLYFMGKNNISPLGMDGEEKKINEILKKMGTFYIIHMHNVFFSAGTMFWYRTNSMKKLFLVNWNYDDFPEEPIGISGSLAHAIERLPVFVAESEGYSVISYINKDILIKNYFDSMLSNILKENNINNIIIKKEIKRLIKMIFFKVKSRTEKKLNNYPLLYKYTKLIYRFIIK